MIESFMTFARLHILGDKPEKGETNVAAIEGGIAELADMPKPQIAAYYATGGKPPSWGKHRQGDGRQY